MVTNCCSLTLSPLFLTNLSSQSTCPQYRAKNAQQNWLAYSIHQACARQRSHRESHTTQLSTKNTGLFMKEYAALQSPIVPQYYFWISIDTFALPWSMFCIKTYKILYLKTESCIFTYDRLLIQLGANWLWVTGNSRGSERRESLHIPKYTI